MTIPEDFRENLEKYLSYLDRKIDLEEDVLIASHSLADDPDSPTSSLGTKEPIIKVILAYKGAREYFLDYFPELRK